MVNSGSIVKATYSYKTLAVNCLMQCVTSTILLLFCNWLHITVRFILGYVVRRLVITIIIIIIIINNQVLRKIKIAVENDVKNWAYISLR